MKRKALSALLATARVATMLAGCGSTQEAAAPAAAEETKEEAPAAEETKEEAPAAEEEAPAAEEVVEEAAAEEGKVFNIYCWNEEFKSRLTDHYPGYEVVDGTHGKIGDIEVVWNITPSDDNAYQNNLDATLLKQNDAAADDKIDLFLVEADYALKYVDTDYTASVLDLGVSEADLADQYQYTKDIVTDSNGVLKGVSWQGCPGVMVCRRDIAKEVFGTDDPDELQKNFADWATYKTSAQTLKDAGYRVSCSVNDTFRIYSNNVTSKWVEDGKINVDANIKAWVDDSKELFDAGMTGDADLWSDDWNAGMYMNENVFSYYGPAWLIDFCMAKDSEGSVANAGDYVAIVGPQSFFWGGTWICGATGTDNASLVADIIKQLTCNVDIMTDIVKADNDFVNNKPAMEAMAADTTYGDDCLGGQNALGIFCAGVEKIDLSNLSPYDQGCNESFQAAMKDYFEGNYSYEEALDAFYTSVTEKYPELTY